VERANPETLYGIFGDAQWTNKDRLSDAMLRDLVEHFSALELTVANLPEDELGQGYEYLILCLLAAHSAEPGAPDRPLRHPLPARRSLPPGRNRHAAQAH
jgi:type I restriction enzyme M protein